MLLRVRTVGWVGMVFCLMSASTFAQPIPLDRLPPDVLDVIQMGVGARTHCDVVVKIDEPAGRIHAIGGNVGRAVSLKLFREVPGGRTDTFRSRRLMKGVRSSHT
jgi:hypothetical protein